MRMSLTIIIIVVGSHTYSHFPYLKSHQNHYYDEYREGILRLAKTFLNSLSNQVVDKTMVADSKYLISVILNRL